MSKRADSFTDRNKGTACGMALEHIAKTLQQGGSVLNVRFAEVPDDATPAKQKNGGYRLDEYWSVVTVVTDVRDDEAAKP